MGNAAPRDLPPVDMTPSIIDEQVGEHCIFLYSTTVCGYCTKAKSLLNHINAEFGVAELDTMSSRESGNVFNNLVKRTNCRTVCILHVFPPEDHPHTSGVAVRFEIKNVFSICL